MNKDGKDIRNIGDGVELPRAGRAIVVVLAFVFVMVMVNHAKEQRHAQIEQAYD
ncbi:MAG: hypothetical protein ABSH14_13835 [Verrucomicrobiia bacterium]|jgi:hypothetical protein